MLSRQRKGTEAGKAERPRAVRQDEFLCECGESLCAERLSLAPEEYERLPGPALAPGHEPTPRRRPGWGAGA